MIEALRFEDRSAGEGADVVGRDELHARVGPQCSDDVTLLQMRKHELRLGLSEVVHQERRLQHGPALETRMAHGFLDIPFVRPVFLPPIARSPSAESSCAFPLRRRTCARSAARRLRVRLRSAHTRDVARRRCRRNPVTGPRRRHARPTTLVAAMRDRRGRRVDDLCAARGKIAGRTCIGIAREHAHRAAGSEQLTGRGAALGARGSCHKGECRKSCSFFLRDHFAEQQE